MHGKLRECDFATVRHGVPHHPCTVTASLIWRVRPSRPITGDRSPLRRMSLRRNALTGALCQVAACRIARRRVKTAACATASELRLHMPPDSVRQRRWTARSSSEGAVLPLAQCSQWPRLAQLPWAPFGRLRILCTGKIVHVLFPAVRAVGLTRQHTRQSRYGSVGDCP